MTDWSGQIQVEVFFEDKDIPPKNPFGSVLVPSDFVLIGGGAEPLDVNAGAYLTESRPDWVANRWYARSKDHAYVDVHRLRIYAIGLKIQGVTPATLRSVMTTNTQTTPLTAHAPNTFAYIPSPYILIGGGAKAIWNTYGSLLVHSYPVGNGWYVKSKDHIYSELCRITAWAIGIQDYIPGFGYIDISLSGNSNYVSSGLNTTTLCCGTGGSNWWVPASVGAQDDAGGAGRLLTSMRPQIYLSGDFGQSKSKDLNYFVGGDLSTYIIQIRKRP